MDIQTLILHSFFSTFRTFWWIIPLLLITLFLKSAVFKGWFGEKLVRTRAASTLDATKYQAFHDLIIPDNRGTTQIDHIYLSRFGIFVVETKHYQGWIYGSEQQARWTQIIYRKKSSFQNPLRQNYRHIKALSSLLGLPESCFHSVVVFSGNYQFKTKMPPNVCDLANFDRYIKTFQTALLSPQQIETTAAVLLSPNFTATPAKKREHVRALQAR